jgi:hypothetical protein
MCQAWSCAVPIFLCFASINIQNLPSIMYSGTTIWRDRKEKDMRTVTYLQFKIWKVSYKTEVLALSSLPSNSWPTVTSFLKFSASLFSKLLIAVPLPHLVVCNQESEKCMSQWRITHYYEVDMFRMLAKTHFALNNVHYCSPVLTSSNFSQTLQQQVSWKPTLWFLSHYLQKDGWINTVNLTYALSQCAKRNNCN